MADIFPLHDAHAQAQLLLPWRVNGTLEAGEAALFDAHLETCAECRADFEANLALREKYATLPLEPQSAVRQPIRARQASKIASASRFGFLGRASRSWAVPAAVAAAAAVVVFLALPSDGQKDDYHLLASDAGARHGNAIVLFAPDTAERDLRAALNRAGAKLVDGPTASGAYVVELSASQRAAALEHLRASRHVVLAEPIDGSADR